MSKTRGRAGTVSSLVKEIFSSNGPVAIRLFAFDDENARYAGVGRDPGRASSPNLQLSPHPMKEKVKEKEFFWFRLRRAA